SVCRAVPIRSARSRTTDFKRLKFTRPGGPSAARFVFQKAAKDMIGCGLLPQREDQIPILPITKRVPCGLLLLPTTPAVRNLYKKQEAGRDAMSKAVSVYHGGFGRATLYELNRPMTTHAHREGHLIFYVGRGHAEVPVCGKPHGVTERVAVAVNPWEPHAFIPSDFTSGGLYLVLYVDHTWFQRMGRIGSSALQFGRSEIEVTPRIGAMVGEVVSLLEDFDTAENFDGTLFELTDACFEQSWRVVGGRQRYSGPASPFI